MTFMKIFHRPVRQLLAVLAVVMSLAGCATVGPEYIRPAISVSPAWNTPLKTGMQNSTIAPPDLESWWTALNDTQLDAILRRAVSGNLDLKQARARVREARARRTLARSGFFPTLDASISGSRSRSSENAGSGATTNFYSVGFDASWEIDLFGGVRRSVEAASADLDVSREDFNNTLVSLLSEVALNCVELRAYQTRLAVAEANLRAQAESYQLTVWRNEAGLSDQLAPGQSGTAPPFKTEDIGAIARDIPGVAGVAPLSSKSVKAVFGNQNWSTAARGSDNQYFKVTNAPVGTGREFTESELRAGSAVCVIGETVRKNSSGALIPWVPRSVWGSFRAR